MIDSRPKRAVIAALSCEADLCGLVLLPSLETQAGAAFLKWLDWSGLSLPFFARLQQHHTVGLLSENWHRALNERRLHNADRTRDMLEEARRHAVDRLVKNATTMGANGVVMMRFDSAEIGQTMSEIVAYGTAVVLDKAD